MRGGDEARSSLRPLPGPPKSAKATESMTVYRRLADPPSPAAPRVMPLRMPVAGWYTWQGDCIEGKGVEPDMLVENSPESLATGADYQLSKAREAMKTV